MGVLCFARSELCRLIARLDLPISFGESDAFQEYITRAHNPRFILTRQHCTKAPVLINSVYIAEMCVEICV
jgi:hypothetical protein